MKRITFLLLLILFMLTGCYSNAAAKGTVGKSAGSSDSKITIFMNSISKQEFLIGILDNNKFTVKHTGINGYDFFLSGKWVYYIKADDKTDAHALYRIKTDGTSNTKVADNYMSDMCLSDNKIYYTGSDFKLYRMGIDGKGAVKLSDDRLHDFIVLGGWVYYTLDLDECASGGKLYKVMADGSHKKKLSNETEVSNLEIRGNTLYYLGKDYCLYRINTDGTKANKICSAIYYCISGDTIFYSRSVKTQNGESPTNIYQYNIKTSASKLTRKGSYSFLSVYNSKIFSVGTDWCLHCLSLDGKQDKKLSNDSIGNYTIIK